MTKEISITLTTLGIIALILLIIALVYIILAARKVSIVYKKADYLVEDLTYKSEMLMPTVSAIKKLTKYSGLLDDYINDNTEFIYDFLKKHNFSIENKKLNKTKPQKTTAKSKQ